MVPVNAQVARIDSMSAHADRTEILRWLGTLPAAPGRLCLVHGEAQPMESLKERIARQLGWQAYAPDHLETIAV
jgi:metallo-beta-lactamase family protein